MAALPAGQSLLTCSLSLWAALRSLVGTSLQSGEQLLAYCAHLACLQTPGSIWHFSGQEVEKVTAEHILYLYGDKCAFCNNQTRQEVPSWDFQLCSPEAFTNPGRQNASFLELPFFGEQHYTFILLDYSYQSASSDGSSDVLTYH